MSLLATTLLSRRTGWVVLIVLALGIQLITIDHTNPPEHGVIPVSDTLLSVLEQSCFDCHSNRTNWPWYSYIAPASWLVGRDVSEAREHMNFTEWSQYTPEDKTHFYEEIWEEVEEGEMPLWYYTLMHPSARVSDADYQTFRKWSTSNGGVPGLEGGKSDSHDY